MLLSKTNGIHERFNINNFPGVLIYVLHCDALLWWYNMDSKKNPTVAADWKTGTPRLKHASLSSLAAVCVIAFKDSVLTEMAGVCSEMVDGWVNFPALVLDHSLPSEPSCRGRRFMFLVLNDSVGWLMSPLSVKGWEVRTRPAENTSTHMNIWRGSVTVDVVFSCVRKKNKYIYISSYCGRLRLCECAFYVFWSYTYFHIRNMQMHTISFENI